ncbi:MAG TPA: hypothetical protein PLZ99_00150 [Parcubacteria group bacterium]|jgi:uncharacterized protein HemX|nr:hypothetical protein [Parcubacteria group bacterium]
MEPNTQTNAPLNNMPPVSNIPPMGEIPNNIHENKSSIGGILGTILVIAIIILGGLYFWGKRIDEAKLRQENAAQQAVFENSQNTTIQEVSEADKIKSVGNSDDVSSLEAELNATNLNGLGAELDAELE